MIVIFKNEEGTLSVRPAFIGFIKNDVVRRVLCSLFYPVTLVCTIALNLLQAALVSVVVFVRAVWYPLSKVKPIWRTEIWHRPRTKADANKRLN
jgi:hypothetical protein